MRMQIQIREQQDSLSEPHRIVLLRKLRTQSQELLQSQKKRVRVHIFGGVVKPSTQPQELLLLFLQQIIAFHPGWREKLFALLCAMIANWTPQCEKRAEQGTSQNTRERMQYIHALEYILVQKLWFRGEKDPKRKMHRPKCDKHQICCAQWTPPRCEKPASCVNWACPRKHLEWPLSLLCFVFPDKRQVDKYCPFPSGGGGNFWRHPFWSFEPFHESKKELFSEFFCWTVKNSQSSQRYLLFCCQRYWRLLTLRDAG